MNCKKLLPVKFYAYILIFIFSFQTVAIAQYFGRNKVNYTDFDFSVLNTPHFEIYHYLQDTSVRNRFALQAEQWYRMHQAILKDTFKEKNPMIIYNTHGGFQQTRAIEGQIGVGTGGVTEALKNRVVMPFMESNTQTDHVLGHELVHAFQYHVILDSFSLRALNNLPLWMIEGMAEYLSLGPVDAHTALWLRGAVLNDKIPTLKELTNRPDLYFPYRYGQAFWAFVGGTWGDTIINRLFLETAHRGLKDALKKVLKMDEKAFSQKWKESFMNDYAPYKKTTSTDPVGRSITNKRELGNFNVIPSISPDGRYIAFWTAKEIFTHDLYLADAITGKTIRRLTSRSLNNHIDEYSSFESSVAWSPDGSKLAFIAFAKGKNQLIIVNTDAGSTYKKIDVPGINGLSNPSWSPDGNTIVFTGLVSGKADLYTYDLLTEKTAQLTDDLYADIQPSFSPDGKWIAFSTDRLSLGSPLKLKHDITHNIALYNVSTGDISNLDFFAGAQNLNPVFGPDNNTIYFLSDRDGFRNLYTYSISDRKIFQKTNLFLGITGITPFSPAVSVSGKSGSVAYSYFNDGTYYIYVATPGELQNKETDKDNVNMTAATLPPFARHASNTVERNIDEAPYPAVAVSTLNEIPFKSKFKLDYIGNTGVGIGTGPMGTGLAGGINTIFSDILGNHQLYGAASLNGEIYDFGAQLAYLNREKRFNWGAQISHVPYISGAEYLSADTITVNGDTLPVVNSSIDILHTFENQVSLFASYPFSQTKRLEAGASFALYNYRLDEYTTYYYNNIPVAGKREKLDAPEGFNFGQAYLALVGDNSFFGVASPLKGSRYRFEAGQYFGVVDMQSLLADYRHYFRLPPFTVATRSIFTGRFGKNAEDAFLYPLFLGNTSLIRGYDAKFFYENTNLPITINDLIGSKIYVANAEIRLPLSGPERLSLIRSRYFLTELNLFTDGGIAWGSRSAINESISIKDNLAQSRNRFIVGSGVSLRVNLFGYLVIEPYYAVPWQLGGFKNASFGLNFIPGW